LWHNTEGNLSAVGTAMMMATSAHNLPDGQSHAPAPFYISVQPGGAGLAHGLLLNSHRYSMFDVGLVNDQFHADVSSVFLCA
jgi:hypothetical protein